MKCNGIYCMHRYRLCNIVQKLLGKTFSWLRHVAVVLGAPSREEDVGMTQCCMLMKVRAVVVNCIRKRCVMLNQHRAALASC